MKNFPLAAAIAPLVAGALVIGAGTSAAAAAPGAGLSAAGTAASGTIVPVLCRYGSPNCVNPYPGPQPPSVDRPRLPDSGWVDPDCRYYGNCDTGNPGSWGDPSLSRQGRVPSGMPGRPPGMGWQR